MKIAIVHDFLQSMGGAERVTLALSELYPTAPVYTLTYNPKLDNFFDGKQIITSHLQKWQFIPARFLISLYPKAIEEFDFSKFDIVISSSHSFAKNIITKPETIHVSYIHSPMRYAWDEAHTHLKGQAYRTPLGRMFGLVESVVSSIIHRIRIWDRLGSSRVDVFVANSKNVRNRIRKYYRRDAEVIYPPVDTHLIKLQPQAGDYFLIVSRLSHYKRVDLAVEACRDLDLPLVVIGTGEDEALLRSLAGSKTKILGWVDDAEKIKYLEGCRGLIFPGEEDFGIVPVEAMAAGKPVIAYRKGGLLETVIESKTGTFFSEQTVPSLKSALQSFINQESNFNPAAIRQHAECFSQERFNREISTLVNQLFQKRL